MIQLLKNNATFKYDSNKAAMQGRLAHNRCSVEGCPWRMDFSLAEALLMASSGRELAA
jgi:hypothetical protein